MGYRSDVCIAMDSSSKEALDAYCDLEKEIKEHDTVSALISDACGDNTSSDGVYKVFWGGIKWYDCHEDISAMDEFLNYLPCDAYGFIRIGEDTEDIEERGFPYDFDVYVSRSIEW